jgi:hypothetical protein
VADQYRAAVNAGAKFEFWDPETEEDPYAASPRLAIEDLRNNHHMYVFPTSAGYGSELSEEDVRNNPLLADSGERWNGKPVTYNDMFRAIHDYFGHGKDGVGFRADGEENAWRSHASMFSPLARLAMTTETRGQNSWLNYGPHGDSNRTAGVDDTVFADQKAGVLPLWAHHEGAEDFMHPDDVTAMGQLYDRPARADGGSIDDEGIPAYHGTPHDFDRFDLSKIGTGQGEQAYGHGLYFAGDEGVAKTYRDDLSSQSQLIDGRPVGELSREALMSSAPTPDQEVAKYINAYGRTARNVISLQAPHLLDHFDRMSSEERIRPAGKMYEVRIKAHPDSIMDWDKKLSEQPNIMRALAEQHASLDPSHEKFETLNRAHQNISARPDENVGAHAHYYLRTALGNKGASDYLSGMGIKGIKYLDTGSRGVGEGTQNYVIFDDSLVNVARKYRRGGGVEVYARGGRANEQDNIWWHGSVSGDLRGGKTGLHLGTKAAAEDALHARIGFPAEGSWDGTREYGETLLAGKKKILERNKYGLTGRNVSAPDEDYYAHEHPEGPLKHWNGEEVDPSSMPSIRPFKIKGPMTNSVYRPHDDWKANGYMQGALKRGNAKSGYFYKNEGEDVGSISAVVPNGGHLEPVPQDAAPQNINTPTIDDRTARFSGGRVNTNPTEAQKAAGNYKKGHTTFQGLDITIENPKGSKRSGVGDGGKRWSVTMPAHYGYIKRTEGADGDHVDVYLGPSSKSNKVFVVDQQDHKTKAFDEHKVMLGYDRERDALADYKRAFSDGKGSDRVKHITEMTVAEFKVWLRHCNTRRPVRSRAIVDKALSTLSRRG